MSVPPDKLIILGEEERMRLELASVLAQLKAKIGDRGLRNKACDLVFYLQSVGRGPHPLTYFFEIKGDDKRVIQLWKDLADDAWKWAVVASPTWGNRPSRWGGWQDFIHDVTISVGNVVVTERIFNDGRVYISSPTEAAWNVLQLPPGDDGGWSTMVTHFLKWARPELT